MFWTGTSRGGSLCEPGLTSVDATGVGNNAEDDESDQEGDLEAGKEELDLSVVLDTEEVCGNTDEEEYGDVRRKLGGFKSAD